MGIRKYRLVKNSIIYVSIFVFSIILESFRIENAFISALRSGYCYAIYVGMIVSWAIISIRRIMSVRIRHLFVYTAVAMIIWLSLRHIRYMIPGEYVHILNLCWYLYYTPLLVIVFFISMILVLADRRDNYKIPLIYKLQIVPVLALSLLVATNDCHQWAFKFKEGYRELAGYTYGWLFYLLIAWAMLSFAIAFASSFKRLKYISHKEKLVWPVLVVAAELLYCVIYFVTGGKLIESVLDISKMFIFATVSFLESLVQIDLIPSNMDYKWCFMHSTVKSQVLNLEGKPVYSALNARPIDEALFQRLIDKSRVSLDSDTEVSMTPIVGGFVVWEKNIHDINRMFESLMDTQTSIKNVTDSLKDTLKLESLRHKIREQSHLYDLIYSQIDTKFEYLESLIEHAGTAVGDDLKETLRESGIIGVYLKRKSNLILLTEFNDTNFGRELKLCFKETFENLKIADVDSDFFFREIPKVDFKMAVCLYDCLEMIVERTYKTLDEIVAIVTDTLGTITLTVCTLSQENIDGESFLNLIKEVTPGEYVADAQTERDKERLSFMITFRKAGSK